MAFLMSPLLLSAAPPRLVVGIMVDGLQREHLDAFHGYFVDGGLKTIIDGGTSFSHIRYSITPSGNASDVATVVTGVRPAYHGITGNVFFNRRTGREESILLDNNQAGIGTELGYSAHLLLSSTFSDELVMSTSRLARCYAVGIDPETVIMLGGHTARSVAWIDDIHGHWATTSYYGEGLSLYADRMNMDGRFDSISYRRWTPLFPLNSYVWNPNRDARAFDLVPAQPPLGKSRAAILRRTPAANTLVTELALALLKGEHLGHGTASDVLMLQYTVRIPNEEFASVRSIEKEDIYMRLDLEVKRLLQTIKQEIGMEQTIVFLFANQSEAHSPAELAENKIPSGYFNSGRATALLNTYLMALYGHERWVSGYSGKHIFLDRLKIEERGLDLCEMQGTVAAFMLEFEGVRSSYTASEIRNLSAFASAEGMAVHNCYHKDSGGDVVISLLPGWIEVDQHDRPVGCTASAPTDVPVFFYGGSVPRQVVTTPYDMTDLAPTLAAMLGIRAPNACTGQIIKELYTEKKR